LLAINSGDDVMQRADVWMVQRSYGASLTFESFTRLRHGFYLRRKHVNGGGSTKPAISRFHFAPTDANQ
jgi:hypothetical protein